MKTRQLTTDQRQRDGRQYALRGFHKTEAEDAARGERLKLGKQNREKQKAKMGGKLKAES
jgi:hypothetical protein